MPWCTDGPSEGELGSSLESTLADWADRAHAQGGTVVIPHFPVPNGEPAVLATTGPRRRHRIIDAGTRTKRPSITTT